MRTHIDEAQQLKEIYQLLSKSPNPPQLSLRGNTHMTRGDTHR